MRLSEYIATLIPLSSIVVATDHTWEHDYIEDGVIEDLTFGHHGSIWAKDHRHITGWTTSGYDYTPELHSDRVVLTPPWPGNKKGAIWAQHPETHSEWDAEFEFRATGIDNHGTTNNLQFWYVRNPTNDVGYNSIYTVGKFDGVAVQVSQFGGTGGTVRAFLNDGSLDFKTYNSVDDLYFGSCDFQYKNLGKFSKIKVSQTFWTFSVHVDGKECIKTHKIHLPHKYFFGLTAASGDTPDSFEAHSFIVHKLKEGKKIAGEHGHGTHPDDHKYTDETEQWMHDSKDWLHHGKVKVNHEAGHDNNQEGWNEWYHGTTGATSSPPSSPSSSSSEHNDYHYDDRGYHWTAEKDKVADHDAGYYKSESERFADLHDRVTSIYHQLDLLYYDITIIKDSMKARHEELKHVLSLVQMGIDTNKHSTETTKEDVKTMKDLLNNSELKELVHNLHWTFAESHLGLHEALKGSNPRMNFFALLIVASNVMLLGSYAIYRRRLDRSHQKYL